MALSSAERQRLFRARRKQGIQMVTIEIDQEVVERLLAKQLLDSRNAGNLEAIARSVTKALRKFLF